MIGGHGTDRLIGGDGNDKFVIDVLSSRENADIIADFGKGDDVLDFGTDVKSVYVKTEGRRTILQDGAGQDAKVYAVLQGFTEDLDAHDVFATDFTFIDIV